MHECMDAGALILHHLLKKEKEKGEHYLAMWSDVVLSTCLIDI